MEQIIIKDSQGLQLPFSDLWITGISIAYTGDIQLYLGILYPEDSKSSMNYVLQFNTCTAKSGEEEYLVDNNEHIGLDYIWKLLGRQLSKCNVFNNGIMLLVVQDVELSIPPDVESEHWSLKRFDQGASFSIESAAGEGFYLSNKRFKVRNA